jgi:hypothetical protein
MFASQLWPTPGILQVGFSMGSFGSSGRANLGRLGFHGWNFWPRDLAQAGPELYMFHGNACSALLTCPSSLLTAAEGRVYDMATTPGLLGQLVPEQLPSLGASVGNSHLPSTPCGPGTYLLKSCSLPRMAGYPLCLESMFYIRRNQG